jgi:hypothetical protein
VNKATVNESPTDKLVKDLQAQIDELKKALATKPTGSASTWSNPSVSLFVSLSLSVPTSSVELLSLLLSSVSLSITRFNHLSLSLCFLTHPTAGAISASDSAQREDLAARLSESERLRKEYEMSTQQKEVEVERMRKARNDALADMGVTLGELGGLAESKLPRLVNLSADPAVRCLFVCVVGVAVSLSLCVGVFVGVPELYLVSLSH